MPWHGIVGHDSQRDALWRAYQTNRLGHSYLFVGPEGIGKRRFAQTLAETISCETVAKHLDSPTAPAPCGTCTTCLQIKAGGYPDLHVVGLPEDKQEFPIALMQDLIGSLSMKPQRAGARRIAIIDDADAFNEESANCFLKTLEEPAPESLLILIGTAAERQLPTIRSRCQVVTFQPLNQADFVTAAQSAGIITDAKAVEAIYPLAQGSLSRAMLMQDAELLKITGDIAKAFQSPKFASVAFGTMLVKFCDGVKEGALKRQRAQFAIEFVVQLLQSALLQIETGVPTSNPHQQAITRLANLTSIDALPQLLETAMEAEHHIDRRFQLALLLEVFADRMGRVLS